MVLHRDCSRCVRKQHELLTSGAPKRFVASKASVIAIVALCANRVYANEQCFRTSCIARTLRVLFVCYVLCARFPQMLRACLSLCLRSATGIESVGVQVKNAVMPHGILNGAPKRIRTANRQNRNLMRYPVAPWVHICILAFFAVFVERKRIIGVFSTRISDSIEMFRLF